MGPNLFVAAASLLILVPGMPDWWVDIMSCVWDFFYTDKYLFYWNAAAIFGIIFIGRQLLQELCGLLSGFYAFVLAPLGLGAADLSKHGSWAVVTGASRGIGRGYALELARRGLNVVLMSRSEEKLSLVAMEIREKFGRDCRVISVNFADGMDVYHAISKQLSGLDIGVLVNNVGISLDYPDEFTNVSAKRHYDMVLINCQTLLQMTHILLSKMVYKGGGIIVNISSGASRRALPHCTVYCATKVFVNYISDGLRKEYGHKGITIQAVTANLVSTAMTSFHNTNFFIRSPMSFVKAAVATIGIQNTTYGCFPHALSQYPVISPDCGKK